MLAYWTPVHLFSFSFSGLDAGLRSPRTVAKSGQGDCILQLATPEAETRRIQRFRARQGVDAAVVAR